MDPDGSAASGGALDVFADWLSQREQGEIVAFERLLERHPGLEQELAELHATWERLSAASEPVRSSLQERIESRFGKESLTEVSLRQRADGESEAERSTTLIAQLSAHGKGFGRYTIRGEVARGGMGAILKIWDAELRRHLAMKVILGQAEALPSGETPPVESSKIARFLEEAQVTGQLDHPGIVPVHELGLDPQGRLYFTMKLVKGESLHAIFEHVREGRAEWTQTRALNVLLKVCEAMAYAHDKGVIHRDLKPANVMVGKFGEVHVMDWGLARIEGQKDRKDVRIRADGPGPQREALLCTMDGDVLGTPNYMPPEQAAGRVEEIGPPSDVYALGAMIYHLVSGYPPYLGRGRKLDNHEVLARVKHGPPEPIEQLAPDVPPELAAICERAMSRDWRLRYRDMSQLAEDLSAYLHQRVVRTYETGTWAETRKWVRRNRSLAAALAAAVLLLVAGVITSSLFARRARDKAIEAQANAAEATRQKQNVLKLSASQTLLNLEQRAEALWPADAAHVDAYRAWLQDAEQLLAQLPDLRAALAESEARALPLSEDERARELAANPAGHQLELIRPKSLWMSRMVGALAWPKESEVDSELEQEGLPKDARSLQALAAKLVGPEEPVLGSEVRALLLARRAFVAAEVGERAGIRITLALAYANMGRFEEGLGEARLALVETPSSRKKQCEGLIRVLESYAQDWRGADGRLLKSQVQAADKLARERARLEAELARRQNWRFAEEESGEALGLHWWHEQLQNLVADLERFGDPELGLQRGVSETQGLGIARRLALATQLVASTLSGDEARARWSEAIDAIARSEKYAGVKWPGGARLSPQLGLLPLGPDPESGLWEFADLQTGEAPRRGADGRLVVSEEMSVVFVLLPGGSFWMGAQRTNPEGQNYDPEAQEDESPVHEVELSPFLLSKYEMTQGQWMRVAGANPSAFQAPIVMFGHRINLTYPLERVSTRECAKWMHRLGLELPSEAEWEYGCRGGTDTPWWTGSDVESLNGKVNLGDQSAHRAKMKWLFDSSGNWPDLEDGWVLDAPVGSLGANAFGLYDMAGNVWERCGDFYLPYSSSKQVDPVVPEGLRVSDCVGRGGGFADPPETMRSARRDNDAPDNANPNSGLRPARKIKP